MKTIFTLLILISNLTLFSQTQDVVGNYKLTLGAKDSSSFEYEVTLDQDGTFSFHYYSNIKQGIPPEVNKYGKGNWTIKNNVISFFSDKQKDFDEKFTLDFTNTKARFVTKSPRDKSDKIIKTQLRFLDSEIFWMRRIDIDKI
ncbi:MAG: hypothetical protein RLZZ540_527 [Bacteroidota bacterium]